MIWAYPTGRTTDWARLIGKGESTPRNYGLWVEAKSGNLLSQIYGVNGGDLKVTSLPLNTWSHIAATFTKGGVHEVFVDGVSAERRITTGTPLTSDDPITIGRAPIHTGFIGMLQDGRVYNRAADPHAIQSIAKNPPTMSVPRPHFGLKVDHTTPRPDELIARRMRHVLTVSSHDRS